MLNIHVRYIAFFFLPAILLSGCITTRVKDTDTKSNEAVIFGRIIVTSEKEIRYEDIKVALYSENGSPILARPDKEGYFYTKAPLSKFYLHRFDYMEGFRLYSIPLEYKFAEITKTDAVYYVGDINLDWSPDEKYQVNKITFKIEKPLRERLPETRPDIKIENGTMDFFIQKFPGNKKPIRISVLR